MSAPEGWVRVVSAGDVYEAELAAGRLREEGVDTAVVKAEGAPGAWLTGSENPFGPVDVYVPSAQVGVARRQLGETDQIEPGLAETRGRSATRTITAAVVVVSIVAAVGALLVDLLT